MRKFDTTAYFQSLEHAAKDGGTIVVSPLMSRMAGFEHRDKRDLYCYLAAISSHPERIFYVKEPR